jgi:hypothetical protein
MAAQLIVEAAASSIGAPGSLHSKAFRPKHNPFVAQIVTSNAICRTCADCRKHFHCPAPRLRRKHFYFSLHHACLILWPIFSSISLAISCVFIVKLFSISFSSSLSLSIALRSAMLCSSSLLSLTIKRPCLPRSAPSILVPGLAATGTTLLLQIVDESLFFSFENMSAFSPSKTPQCGDRQNASLHHLDVSHRPECDDTSGGSAAADPDTGAINLWQEQ